MNKYVITNRYIDDNGNGQDLIISIAKEITIQTKKCSTTILYISELGPYAKDRFELMLSNFIDNSQTGIYNTREEAIDTLKLFIDKNKNKMVWKSPATKEVEGKDEWELKTNPPSKGVFIWFYK